jgi:hypothetical protein
VTDLYDKLISVLGLDDIRTDHLFGKILREFPELEFSDGPGRVTPSLCRLPDGRTQLVFRVASVGDHWVGFLPCSAANLTLLDAFLTRARRHFPEPGSGLRNSGLVARLVRAINPGDPLETMPNPLDRHLEYH